jgi:hypothetical protein
VFVEHVFSHAPILPSVAPRPEKICVTCGRPFTWRKKWERDWEHVKYCSDACRKGTPRGAR